MLKITSHVTGEGEGMWPLVLTQEVPLGYIQMKWLQRLEEANTDANTQHGLVSLSSGAIFSFL